MGCQLRFLATGVAEVEDCNDDGWRWAESEDGEQHTIELCGDACTRFQASGDLQIEFSCE